MRACFAIALDTQMKHSGVKSKSVCVDNFVKIKADAKSFVWNFSGNLVNKADGTDKVFNSVYCAYKVAK